MPPRTVELLLATTNPGKLAELRSLFAVFPLRLIVPSEAGLDLQVPEEAPDYATNAAAKAIAYAQASGTWALADDTGLEVDALGGMPGVRSARLAKEDSSRRAALLARLSPFPRPWTARFRCAIVLSSPAGDTATGQGACPGEIIPEARGGHGFGYDPIFLVEGTGLTMAELPLDSKNRLSHRGRAVVDLLRALENQPWQGAPLGAGSRT